MDFAVRLRRSNRSILDVVVLESSCPFSALDVAAIHKHFNASVYVLPNPIYVQWQARLEANAGGDFHRVMKGLLPIAVFISFDRHAAAQGPT